MSEYKLSKREAIDLITPVVDNEVSDEEKKAFFEYIQQDEEVRRKYQTALNIKKLLGDRCPRTKAPDSLRDRVCSIIENLQSQDVEGEEADPIYDKPCPSSIKQLETLPDTSQKSKRFNARWLYSIAAGILVILLVGAAYYFVNQQVGIADNPAYNIEEYAFQHFERHKGNFVEPNIVTASIASAESELAENYNMSITVPPLANAKFRGIVYSEFVPGYEAPMLEYYLSTEDQYIYIFAFKINELEKFGKLTRNKEAVKKCTKPDDFHIRDINGKHVVSWKWDDVWYAAISNQNGSRLASFIEFPK